MRAFVALRLPEETRRSLAALQRQLADSGADGKWAAPEQLHVTLKFLGKTPPPDPAAVETLLRGIATRTASFPLALGALGAFPSARAPRVIWVGLAEGRERVIGLARAIESSGGSISGWVTEERAFAAHVTLGRARSPRGRAALAAQLERAAWIPPAPWQVEQVVLYESVLRPDGPRHTPLAEIALGVT